MLEAIQVWVSNPDLIWLWAFIVLAGIVRGFSGFGTALIFVPLAAQYISPVAILVVINIIDLVGPMVLVPKAWGEANRRDVGLLLLGSLIGIPLGISLLIVLDETLFRWGVSLGILCILPFLLMGWRHQGKVTDKAIGLIGFSCGFLGGLGGFSGPPIILFYLTRDLAASTIRATIILFFAGNEIFSVVNVGLRGLFTPDHIALGLLLILPYTLANMVGARLFEHVADKRFRQIAYLIIALAAVSAMPIFD